VGAVWDFISLNLALIVDFALSGNPLSRHQTLLDFSRAASSYVEARSAL